MTKLLINESAAKRAAGFLVLLTIPILFWVGIVAANFAFIEGFIDVDGWKMAVLTFPAPILLMVLLGKYYDRKVADKLWEIDEEEAC